VARFGPDGLTGRLATGPFRSPADGLVVTPAREPLPVRFEGEGFAARGEDALPPGQYLGAAVLSDRQQQRQSFYRQLLEEPPPRHWEGRDLLLAWADWDDLPVRAGEGGRTAGAALVVLPVEYERPPAGTRVSVPRAFIPYSRILAGRPAIMIREGSTETEMELRFQLPPSVLPLDVERARVSLKVHAPARRVTVTGPAGGAPKLFEAENPIDPVALDITDPRLLRADPDGGLRLTLRIGAQAAPGPGTTPPRGKGPGPIEEKWKLESLGLDVVGQTAAR
jgi:hypothetical protein